MTDLKPCPFCGGEAERVTLGPEPFKYQVSCADCVCGHVKDSKDIADITWNTRAPSLTEYETQSEYTPAEAVQFIREQQGVGKFTHPAIETLVREFSKQPAESRGMLPSGDLRDAVEQSNERIKGQRSHGYISVPVEHLETLIHHAERNAVEVVTVEELAKQIQDGNKTWMIENKRVFIPSDIAHEIASHLIAASIVKGGG
jgi:hypothetical protein